jgi:hypothetical protein
VAPSAQSKTPFFSFFLFFARSFATATVSLGRILLSHSYCPFGGHVNSKCFFAGEWDTDQTKKLFFVLFVGCVWLVSPALSATRILALQCMFALQTIFCTSLPSPRIFIGAIPTCVLTPLFPVVPVCSGMSESAPLQITIPEAPVLPLGFAVKLTDDLQEHLDRWYNDGLCPTVTFTRDGFVRHFPPHQIITNNGRQPLERKIAIFLPQFFRFAYFCIFVPVAHESVDVFYFASVKLALINILYLNRNLLLELIRLTAM